MENKLQQLTQKLYEEGLTKGRSEAEKLVADAQAKASKIVADAQAQAAAIIAEAKSSAEDVRKNSLTEVALAGKQAVTALKEEIRTMITAKTVTPTVKAANLDGEFVKGMLLAVAANWKGDSAEKVSLEALLPETEKARFDEAFEKSAKELLDAGVEVKYGKNVKSGFKIGQKDGGYYISFSDEDFDALFGEYLREKVSTILYPEK